jgi:hypothetical protein
MEKTRQDRSEQNETIFDQQQSELVWKISARLQAEAAQRLETRSKQLAQTNDSKSIGQGFTVDEIKSIAEEAGIETTFVAQALKQIESDALQIVQVSDAEEARASKFLGTEEKSMVITRIVKAKPEVVLEAMKRILPNDPYNLKLIEILGDESALQDSTMVFEVPQIDMSGATNSSAISNFSYQMSIPDLKRVWITLHEISEGKTEITLSVDMKYGKMRNLNWGQWTVASLGVLGTVIGGVVGRKMGNGDVLGSILGGLLGGTLGTSGTWALWRTAYRSGLNKSKQLLQEMLQFLDTDTRSKGAFTSSKPKQTPNGITT